MIPSMYRDFITKIIEKTNRKETIWEFSGEEDLVLKTKSATIEIFRFSDIEQETSYYYFVYRNIINQEKTGFRVSQFETDDYALMELLYSVASGSANNISEKLEKFLEEIE